MPLRPESICFRVSGTWNLKLRPKIDPPGLRLARFDSYLGQAIHLHSVIPELVAYEEVCHHSSYKAAHLYGAFIGILQLRCYQADIECRGYPVGTIKKFATGNGRASKEDMILAAEKFACREIGDDNEADAICIAELAASGFTS